MNHLWFIHHPSADTGCLHLWAIVNDNAAVNTDVQVSLQDSALNSRGRMFRSRIAGSWGSSMLIFEEPAYGFPPGCTFCIPASRAQELQFLHSRTNTVTLQLGFVSHHNNSQCKGCEAISRGGLDVRFPDDERCWTSSQMLIGHL